MYKKRNVAYVKPQEPSFLKKLKKEAGYVPGPDINTKTEQLPQDSDSETETLDESPVIVVVEPGDLTAEEVTEIRDSKKSDKLNAPADLSKKIIFQKPLNSKNSVEKSSRKVKSADKQKKNSKHLLSFNEIEEDEC